MSVLRPMVQPEYDAWVAQTIPAYAAGKWRDPPNLQPYTDGFRIRGSIAQRKSTQQDRR